MDAVYTFLNLLAKTALQAALIVCVAYAVVWWHDIGHEFVARWVVVILSAMFLRCLEHCKLTKCQTLGHHI